MKLVAVDMDGTLLDAQGRVPEGLWPLLDELARRGVVWAPASGRPVRALRALFADRPGLIYIGDNGTHVMRGEETLLLDRVPEGVAAPVAAWVRGRRSEGNDVGMVVCGVDVAWVERDDPSFVDEVLRYYPELTVVDDVQKASTGAEVLKLAVFDAGRAEARAGPAMTERLEGVDVVVSSADWVDIMRAGSNKGRALRHVQALLQVSPEETVAFGDYLNDVEMLQAASMSYAMADAHPQVKAVARFEAPSNADAGVVQVLRGLLDEPLPIADDPPR